MVGPASRALTWLERRRRPQGAGSARPGERSGSRAARREPPPPPRASHARAGGGGAGPVLMHMHEASQEGAGPPGGRANDAAAVLGPHTKGARPVVTRGRTRGGRPRGAERGGGPGLRGGVPRAPPERVRELRAAGYT